MSTIRCIYETSPNFPAADQHPDAVRYQVGAYWVDAIGGAPTLEEVEAIAKPVAAPRTASAEDVLALLKEKGVVSQSDIDAMRAAPPADVE